MKEKYSAGTIAEYIAGLPEKDRAALDAVYAIIKRIAPEAEGRISYGIPTFWLNGPLIGFSAASKHLSLHIMSPTLTVRLKDELAPYDKTTSTVHFTPEKPLPKELIAKIIKMKMDDNATGKGKK
ncbi:MAG: hypothetical protein A2Y33_05570 [Spirochaetes bacterium GWF1_51_8]|nr:MAG: hypothetical protein A2Y33_05570 [Spirochaetes bacterium GWF1_51_8]